MRFMLLLLAGFLAACPSQRERIITEWRKGADAYCACETLECFSRASDEHNYRRTQIDDYSDDPLYMIQKYGPEFERIHAEFLTCAEPFQRFYKTFWPSRQRVGPDAPLEPQRL